MKKQEPQYTPEQNAGIEQAMAFIDAHGGQLSMSGRSRSCCGGNRSC